MTQPNHKLLLRSVAALGVLAGALAGLSGCEDSARNAIQVRPIEVAPPVVAEPLPRLPLDARRADVVRGMATRPNGVAWLASRSSAALDAGEQDFRTGHLGKAREEFDQALDLLLASGFDLQTDPRLSSLYHHILETVNADEIQAFRDGDGFREEQSTPAPIDELNALTLPEDGTPDPNLRGRAEGEVKSVAHDLPLTVNDQVLSFLNYFQTAHGRAIIETGLTRAGRYREMIGRVFHEEGLPQDLIYMAQAESAFQPQAVSKAGARGMWQFMSWDGRQQGLQKTWWVDERQDPEKATRAAAHLLQDLYRQFGDWYLVMAAYNSGPNGVAHAIERTGYADFWELYRRNVLPKETRNYVPIILAMALISKDTARYGIDYQPESPVKADLVKPGSPIDLRLVAETIDTDLDTLRTLNPELLRQITPDSPDFTLRLPEGTAERFYAEIAAIPPEKWVSWRRHKVEQGETLSGIAKSYHVLPSQIADANDLPTGATLEEGQKLIIPAAARSEATTGKLVRYRARRDDTVAAIADEFDVSSSELRQWNHLKSEHVARGTRLKIYPGGFTPPAQSNSQAPGETAAAVQHTRGNARGNDRPVIEARSSSVVHRVKSGETLWSIARGYQTTVEAIRAGNHYLFSRPLQVGDTLTILPSH